MAPLRADKGGVTGSVDFQVWGELAKLGSGKELVPETPEWLAIEEVAGEEYDPAAGIKGPPTQQRFATPKAPREPREIKGDPGTGMMVNWLEEKGFGFIKPADGGDDLYAHISEIVDPNVGLAGLRRGDEVQYIKEFNERRSKYQASNISLVEGGKRGATKGGDDDSELSSSGRDERGVGKVIRWNSEKGYGFVKPVEGGEDLFVHVSNLKNGEGSIKMNDQVSYYSKLDKRRDKTRAVDVRVATPEEIDAAKAAAEAAPKPVEEVSEPEPAPAAEEEVSEPAA
jgi:cold shock CspA family protein